MKKLASIFILSILMLVACNRSAPDMTTTFEKSGYLETDSYEGTIAYAKKLAKQFKQVHYEVVGTSAAGRDLPLLIIDENGYTDPAKIRKSGKVILLVESCIHAGEPNGKDAMFMMLKNMLADSTDLDLLEDFSILFIPVLSPDGLAKFSPYNRINQNGPKEMGWRVNAAGLNLNRDFTKLQSPEIRAFVEVFNRWQPDLFFDTHATDGADYQYTTTYAIEDFGNYDAGITRWLSEVWEKRIPTAMARYDIPITRYIEFQIWGDPASALVDHSFSAMFSESYTTARNCPGILLETHMLKPYKDRVFSTYYMILETMKLIRDDKAEFLEVVAQAKENDLKQKEIPINMQASSEDTLWVDFLGYAYEKKRSEISGSEYVVYDSSRPETRKVLKIRESKPTKTLEVPKAYVIPAQYIDVIDVVKAHGFKVETFSKDKTMEVSTYRFSDVHFYPVPSEGLSRISSFVTEPITREVTFPKGSVMVKTDQNGVRLLMNLLEPEMQGSLLEWGFFNTIFQRVEYFETYKMEAMARQMLDDDPLLGLQFQDWLKTFPNGSRPSTYQILNWFYEKTPYCDDNYMVYPVGIVR